MSLKFLKDNNSSLLEEKASGNILEKLIVDSSKNCYYLTNIPTNIRTWSSVGTFPQTYIHGHRWEHSHKHTYMVIGGNIPTNIRTWSSVGTFPQTYIHGHRWEHSHKHTDMVIGGNIPTNIRTWSSVGTFPQTYGHGHRWEHGQK